MDFLLLEMGNVFEDVEMEKLFSFYSKCLEYIDETDNILARDHQKGEVAHPQQISVTSCRISEAVANAADNPNSASVKRYLHFEEPYHKARWWNTLCASNGKEAKPRDPEDEGVRDLWNTQVSINPDSSSVRQKTPTQSSKI